MNTPCLDTCLCCCGDRKEHHLAARFEPDPTGHDPDCASPDKIAPFVPNLRVLRMLAKKVGYKKVELIKPPRKDLMYAIRIDWLDGPSMFFSRKDKGECLRAAFGALSMLPLKHK
jgi:hypothetical protein